MEENLVMDSSILNFQLTREQGVILANHYGKNFDELEEYEVLELLDRLIDELA